MNYRLLGNREAEFDTAVLVAGLRRAVVSGRAALAITDGGEARRRDTLLDQVVDNGLGAVLGERLVVFVGADPVGMTFDHGGDVIVLLEPLGGVVEDVLRFLRELVGVEVEEDGVEEGVIDLALLGLDVVDVDGVDLGLGDDHGVADVLDGRFGRNDDRDVLGLLAEVDTQAEGGAEVHAREAAAVGPKGVAEDGALHVRDDGDVLGDVDRKRDTRTAAGGALVHLDITGVDIRNQPLEGAEEHVTVDIGVRILAEIGVDVARGEALVTETETGPVVEPLAEIDIHGKAAAVPGVVALNILAAIVAEVETAADAGEPVVVSLDGFGVLAEGGEAGAQRDGQCDDSVEFHIVVNFMIFLAEVVDDAEGDKAPEVEREAGVTLIGIEILGVRHQAVVIVRIGLSSQVGEDAQAVLEVVFGDEAEPEGDDVVALVDILPGMETLVIRMLPLVRGERNLIESEGMATAETEIEFRAEGGPGVIEIVHLQDGVHEIVDALEGVRIETVPCSLFRIAGAHVLRITHICAQAESLGEIIGEADGSLGGDQLVREAEILVREGVFIDGQHGTALDGDAELPGRVVAVLGKKRCRPEEEGCAKREKLLHIVDDF